MKPKIIYIVPFSSLSNRAKKVAIKNYALMDFGYEPEIEGVDGLLKKMTLEDCLEHAPEVLLAEPSFRYTRRGIWVGEEGDADGIQDSIDAIWNK